METNVQAILQFGILIAFCVLAIYSTMWYGMIFGKVRDFGESKFPVWLRKIVFDCPICMTPYYGTVIYFLLGKSFSEWIFSIIVSMGIITFWVKIKRQ